jgi:NitT/TauT family transport system substrate-binding protein
MTAKNIKAVGVLVVLVLMVCFFTGYWLTFTKDGDWRWCVIPLLLLLLCVWRWRLLSFLLATAYSALTGGGFLSPAEKNDRSRSSQCWNQRNGSAIPLVKYGVLLLIGLGLLASTACNHELLPPMRIGTDVWPGYEPLFLAQHAGSLNEKDFRLVGFSNSSGVGRAFRNGALEAACLTLDEVFYAVQDDMDPVILLVLDESRGADVLLARPGIKKLAELKGKRIAVEMSAVETYTLIRALQHANLTVKDITPVYLPVERHLEAFQSGAVDAMVTYEPVRTKLLALGAVDLFNSSMIPGEIVDVLVVRRDYLEKHPERGVALRQAWFAALEQMRRSPHEAAKFMAIREQVTAEEFEVSLQGIHLPDKAESYVLLGGNAPKLLASAERLKAVMRDARLLQRDIPLKPIFTLPDAVKPTP